jgi:hypothetical protein
MVQLGKGDGTFLPAVSYATPGGRLQAGTTADLNGDGAPDLVYPGAGGVTVVMNDNSGLVNLAGAVRFRVTAPTSTTAGAALPLTVSAVDADSNVVAGFRGTVFITTTDPAAPVNYSYTFTAANAGTHSFTGVVRLATQGTQTVSIATPRMTTANQTVTVTPAVTHFGVSAPPAANAGDTVNVTVSALDPLGNVGAGYTSTVQFTSSDALAGLPADYTFTPADAGVHTFAVKDPFGNLTTGYTGTVTFSSSDVQAGLPASYTFTAADAGVHTFSAALKTAGAQSITVKDAASPTAVGSQTGIAVTAAPTAASFAVTGFPATTAGVAHGFTVTARDAFGNVCTGYTGTVAFSSSDVQVGLPANYTFTAADAGVHTFSATLKTAGAQSITVQDAANAAILGSETGIAVTAGAAARFLFSVPSSVKQGVGFKFTVTVVDAYGNVATGYRGKVHLSSTDPKQGTQDYTFSSNDNGVHVFSFTFNTPGLQTLFLTDTANGSLAGSAAVNVLAN